MPIYSHSQLITYEECPLKYKLCYRDKIKRDTDGMQPVSVMATPLTVKGGNR